MQRLAQRIEIRRHRAYVTYTRRLVRQDKAAFDPDGMSLRSVVWRDPFGTEQPYGFRVLSIGPTASQTGYGEPVRCSETRHAEWQAAALAYLDAVDEAGEAVIASWELLRAGEDRFGARLRRRHLAAVRAEWVESRRAYRMMLRLAESAYRPVREAIAAAAWMPLHDAARP